MNWKGEKLSDLLGEIIPDTKPSSRGKERKNNHWGKIKREMEKKRGPVPRNYHTSIEWPHGNHTLLIGLQCGEIMPKDALGFFHKIKTYHSIFPL